MLIAYQVIEDIYHGSNGIEEIGLFSLSDSLTKEEIEKKCDEYCSSSVEDIFTSCGLEDEEYWCGHWTCYKVRDDVKLSEWALDNELSIVGFVIFADKYCIKENLTY